MAQATLNAPSSVHHPMNTSAATERGESAKSLVEALNTMLTELYSGGHLGAYVAAGATKSLAAADNGKTVKLDTAGGSVVTLPAATGSGVRYKFLVTVLATSASHKVQVANASDTMIGVVVIEDTDTANATLSFAAASTSDTITLNRTTTGSVSLGEWIDVEDVAANVWAVRGVLTATGNPATPFSAAV